MSKIEITIEIDKVQRNKTLQILAENMPEKLKERTVKPEKGKGRKNRPRNKKVNYDSDCILN